MIDPLEELIENCPKCGNEPVPVQNYKCLDITGWKFHCWKCNIEPPVAMMKNKYKAILYWNLTVYHYKKESRINKLWKKVKQWLS